MYNYGQKFEYKKNLQVLFLRIYIYSSLHDFSCAASKERSLTFTWKEYCNRITFSTVGYATFHRYENPFFDEAEELPLRVTSE